MVISVEKNSRKLSETFIRCFSPPFSLESLDTLLQYVWTKLLKAVFSKMSGWRPSSARMLNEITDLKASMLARGVMPGKFSMTFCNSFFLVIIFANKRFERFAKNSSNFNLRKICLNLRSRQFYCSVSSSSVARRNRTVGRARTQVQTDHCHQTYRIDFKHT